MVGFWFASGSEPPSKSKHLLQLLVEKVLIRGQRTIEVWYRLHPLFHGVRTLGLSCPNEFAHWKKKKPLSCEGGFS